MVPSIVIVDHGVGVAGLDKVAAALQRQVLEHFAAPAPVGWGAPATVRAATAAHPARESEWEIGLFVTPDQVGALGYHDMTPAGSPCSKVFPLLDDGDGVAWSRTASHEILELLADPMCSICAQGPDGQIYACEVCDPVEAFGYEIDGVDVSDWVRPSYFQPPKLVHPAGYDHLGLITKPLEILAGGYNQTFDPRSGWSMIDHGQRAARRASAAARSRSVRRRYPVRVR